MDKEQKQLKVFGYGLAVICGLVSLHIGRHHGWQVAHALLLPAAAVLVVVTTVNAAYLKPFYRRWMAVVHVIGTLITGIVLSILFYLVFGIAGIILRLLRKDLLDRKIDPGARTYWNERPPTVFEAEHYTRQF